MNIDKTSNNVVYYDFRKNNNEKPQVSLPPEKRIIAPKEPISLVHILANKNIVLNKDQRELFEYMQEANCELTPEEIKQAIENYYTDAEKMYPILIDIQQFVEQFKKDLFGIDLSEERKIKNIFGDGNDIPIMQGYYEDEEDMEEYEEDLAKAPLPVSDESKEIMRSLAKMHLQNLQQKLPDYTFTMLLENSDNNDSGVDIIRISKDNKEVFFHLKDFLSAISTGVISDRVVIDINTEGNDPNSYIYQIEDEVLHRFVKNTGLLRGSIATECYNSKGKPQFWLDEDFSFGPSFYAMLIYDKKYDEVLKSKVLMESGQKSDEATINNFIRMIQSDDEIKEFYKTHDMQFMLSCVRQGDFNFNVAEAMHYIMNGVKEDDIKFPLEYVKNITMLIEKEDHYFEENMLAFARQLMVKQNSEKNCPNSLVYKIVNFLNINYCDKHFKTLFELARNEYVNMNEISDVVDVLSDIESMENSQIANKIYQLAEKYQDKYRDTSIARKFYTLVFLNYFK